MATSRRLFTRAIYGALVFAFAFGLASGAAFAQAKKPYDPEIGTDGKDVVWVPTPQSLVELMLDLAKVTPADTLVDLGSGDGRTVITAAKRGLKASGIEYNPKMVELAQFNAKEAGVADRASFAKADLFETDFSHATVLTMFLLEEINLRLRPKILDMKPGTRVVSNTFTMSDWQPDRTERVSDCSMWCTAMLWIVPAKVEGTWNLGGKDLVLKQSFQNLAGTLGGAPIRDAKMTGATIAFSAGGVIYSGTVAGNRMTGVNWSAERK